MEIGYNVMYGQWDWMNDLEIYFLMWEWDMSGLFKYWCYIYNFVYYKYINIFGMDDDVGYGMLCVICDQCWKCYNIFNVVWNIIFVIGFEWGVVLQYLEIGKIFKGWVDCEVVKIWLCEFLVKVGCQVFKDYVVFLVLILLFLGVMYWFILIVNVVVNVICNVWFNVVIFCGYFLDGVEKFIKMDMIGELKGQWYLWQMLGSVNFNVGLVLWFMSGNLCY